MRRESVKQRLIRELERRAFRTRSAELSAYYYAQAECLQARGSGPLPWWAKQFAKDWGIE